ncbi:hypothetical protein KAI52_01410, partial [Candidatus Parcubacteria bacterium]|nr:hypothetical protein [Candidatus Parcubacteria bacterium]
AIEICGDGVDNNCDGEINENWPNLGEICEVGIGACKEFGIYICDPDDLTGPAICSAIPGDNIDCSCAVDTCVGEICSDGCGGTCDGTKVANCSCAVDTCVGEICSDGCGGTCDGTKVANCSCAEDTCVGEICSDGCGGTCAGIKVCVDPAYSLLYFGVYATCLNPVPWDNVVQDSAVVGSSGNLLYSTSLGDWIPANTYIDTGSLKLNISGDRAVNCAKHPRSYLKSIYRVWGTIKVNIKTHTKAETVCGSDGLLRDKLDRIDSFERLDLNTISLNGNPIIINPGENYVIQSVSWNPADNGSGLSFLRINAHKDYFDVIQYVAEVDEQCDSSRVWIEGYIEGI